MTNFQGFKIVIFSNAPKMISQFDFQVLSNRFGE